MSTAITPPRTVAGVATRFQKQDRLSVHDLVTEVELTRGDVELIFRTAQEVKVAPQRFARALAGKQLALIFEKPSLRTRVTFEVGITSMGGFAIYLDHTKPRLGERESISDVAHNLERWVDCIVARTFSQSAVEELAASASIPVINALTDLLHPCQALADFFTLTERFGTARGLKMAFIGDGNNVCHSLMLIAAKCGAHVTVATPDGFEPSPHMVDEARSVSPNAVQVVRDPYQAVEGAHAVYTDVWASMGQENFAHIRSQVFAPYRVTDDLMAAADPSAVFMHCLPAHRGKEVTDSVMDSPRSIVFDQAENRLHAQKALLLMLLGNGSNASGRRRV